MNIRSFLEGKGLTKEEIDEAFRRVLDTLTAVSRAHPVISNQDGQIKPSLSVQQQPPTQVLQPAAVAPVGSTSKIEMLSQFHGYHAILAVGLLAGTAVFFKKCFVPWLKSWIRKAVASEEADEGLLKINDTKPSVAKDAAVVAADAARAIQEMSTTNREEKICFEEIMSTLYAQTQVMKSMINSMQKLESGLGANRRICLDEQDNRRFSGTSSSQPHTRGTTSTDTRSGYSYLPVSAGPSHPMQMMPMLQRGEMPMPLNIRTSSLGINDAPPVPNQPLMNPIKPGPKVKFYNDSRM